MSKSPKQIAEKTAAVVFTIISFLLVNRLYLLCIVGNILPMISSAPADCSPYTVICFFCSRTDFIRTGFDLNHYVLPTMY